MIRNSQITAAEAFNTINPNCSWTEKTKVNVLSVIVVTSSSWDKWMNRESKVLIEMELKATKTKSQVLQVHK